MNTTTTISAAAAVSFYSNIHRAGNPLPRFTLDGSVEDLLKSVPNGREAKLDEADAIRHFMGSYSVGEPHGSQLDAARHAARIARDPRFTEPEICCGQIVQDLTAAERELLRRWRNYERRAMIARNALRDLDAEILEKTEAGDTPDCEECAQRSALVEQVEFWQRRSDNPHDFPLEVDQWGDAPDVTPASSDAAPEPAASWAELQELTAAQEQDRREWNRRAR